MAHELRISLLGDVAIQLGDHSVTGLPARAAEALLIYLVCSPRPVAREKLAELLWAERSPAQALTNLRTILTPLRRALGDYLVVSRQTLAFDHSRAYWLDVTEFEQGFAALGLARRAVPDVRQAQQLQTTLDLYQGDFLEGFYLKEGQGFEEWATLQRERLRHLAREGFRLLADYQLQSGAYLPGNVTAARWRQLDPYSEEACRTQMWLFTRSGQPHLARQCYQDFTKLLHDDLGVAPGANTTRLFERVRTINFPPAADLPPPATSFIGRAAEVDAIVSLIVAPGSRLLTLAGPGGIGKTRLAIEAARQIAQHLPGRFLDGICFVPLAALNSPELIPTHIADALRVTLRGADPPEEQLLSYLAQREALLILDNVEHLLDPQGRAVAFLIEVLRQAPDVKVLLTSRERLHLYEEVIFDVAGLDGPAEGGAAPHMSLASQLFVARARRLRRDYAPDESELACIAQLGRLLHGVPLAIELAASWLRHYDCSDIVRQIEQSLDFLASDFRDLPERQRSLRAVFEYSYRLLPGPEQAALAQLAIFAGGFTADAARAVVGERAPLLELADKSLLQRQPGGRFDLHPLLRVYAAEKLAADPQAQARTADSHAAYFLAFLAAQGSGESAGQRAAIRQELANVRSAWEWAAQRAMWEALAHAAATLHSFYSVQSWFQEGIDLFARALAVLDRAGSANPAPVDLRMELLGRKARLHIHIGGLVQARADLEQAVAGLGQIDHPARRAGVLDSLAITHYYAGDYTQAIALASESLRLSEESNSREGISFATNFLGSCAKAQGDYRQAQVYFQRSAEMALALKDEIGAAMVFNNLGNLLQLTEDWAGAQRYYQQSSELFKAHDHVHGAATTLANAGKLACKQGAYDRARALLNESLALKRTMGDPRGEAVALAGLGDVALATGAQAECRACLLQAIELAHRAGDLKLMLEVLVSFAELLLHEDRPEQAARLVRHVRSQPGATQEVRQRVEKLALQGEDHSAAAAGDRFQDEAAILAWLRLLP